MAKLFVCLFAFISITSQGLSQYKDSLINIKGYYVTRFVKDEISYSYDQKINKLNGKSYLTPIDSRAISFFIPLRIDNEATNNHDKFVSILSKENNLHKDTVYYLPTSKQIEKYLKKICNMNINLSKEVCIFSEVGNISPYYISPNDNKYLYKLLFINGEFVKEIVTNSEQVRFSLNLDIDSVNKNANFLNLFFLVKMNSYSTIVEAKGLKEWFPYSEN